MSAPMDGQGVETSLVRAAVASTVSRRGRPTRLPRPVHRDLSPRCGHGRHRAVGGLRRTLRASAVVVGLTRPSIATLFQTGDRERARRSGDVGWLARQGAEDRHVWRRAPGSLQPDGADAFVFVGEKGGPLRRHVWQKAWDEARAELGLRHLHFHDLRDTGNTLAAATGASTNPDHSRSRMN